MSTEELTALQYDYGYALDDRDADALAAVFDAEIEYRTFAPDAAEPTTTIRGRAAFPLLVEAMAQRYVRTVHAMNNPRHAVDGNGARGRVYGTAHHLIEDGGLRTVVAHLRYEDEFQRGTDGRWRILRRDVRFLWVEEESRALPWDVATVRGRFG